MLKVQKCHSNAQEYDNFYLIKLDLLIACGSLITWYDPGGYSERSRGGGWRSNWEQLLSKKPKGNE